MVPCGPAEGEILAAGGWALCGGQATLLVLAARPNDILCDHCDVSRDFNEISANRKQKDRGCVAQIPTMFICLPDRQIV